MRQDVSDLKAFYASRLGEAARDMILRQVAQAWGGMRDLDMLGLGYATPYLAPYRSEARRTVAAMPAAQGVELWPRGERVLACLTADTHLPFPNALFDRILMIHALEEADDPAAMMAEARRVLAPSGRLIVAAAARGGLWAHAEHTPFGHGRPFTRAQLESVVKAAGLEPTAWSRALYAPPYRGFAPWAEAVEQIGSRLAAPASGVVMLEAVKQTFAVRPKGVLAPAARRPVFHPAPIGATRSGSGTSFAQGETSP
jgi:SAM-dependent methyltransferase